MRRVATTVGVLVTLGASGPGADALATGAARSSARAGVARAVPTGVPKPGDVLPTARRTASTTSASPGGAVSQPAPVRSSAAPARTVPSSPTAGGEVTWWQWVAVAAAGLLVGAAGCYLLLRPRRPGAAPPPTVAPDDGNLATLVSSVIAARDLLDPNSVLSQRLGAALSGGGVQELVPVGQPFDPSRHRAVETAPTTDPAVADRIAEVQRVGYRDDRRTIRPPDVVVYRLEANR